MYDAIIVGAGPGGASAAYWLGKAGKRVLVLEREALPRYKPCGGAVPASVLSGFPFSLEHAIARYVRQARFRFRDGREVVLDLPDQPVAMVTRAQFDLTILDNAAADVKDNCRATSVVQQSDWVEVATRSGEAYRGRYLVGADGASSRVARSVGLRKCRFVGASLDVEVPAERSALSPEAGAAVFLFGTPHYGYQWAFPKKAHVSVGIGAFSASGGRMRKELRAGMKSLGINLAGIPHYGHPLPIYCRHEDLQRGRAILVGDAAGLVDPLIGEGIRYAVRSGKLAADAIASERVDQYSMEVHRQIGDDLLWALRWARLFYGFPEASYELGVRNRGFLEEFLRLLAGENTYRGLAYRAPSHLLRGARRRLPIIKNRNAQGDPYAEQGLQSYSD